MGEDTQVFGHSRKPPSHTRDPPFRCVALGKRTETHTYVVKRGNSGPTFKELELLAAAEPWLGARHCRKTAKPTHPQHLPPLVPVLKRQPASRGVVKMVGVIAATSNEIKLMVLALRK